MPPGCRLRLLGWAPGCGSVNCGVSSVTRKYRPPLCRLSFAGVKTRQRSDRTPETKQNVLMSRPASAGTFAGARNLSAHVQTHLPTRHNRPGGPGPRCPIGLSAVGRSPAAITGKTEITDTNDCSQDAACMQEVDATMLLLRLPNYCPNMFFNNDLRPISKNGSLSNPTSFNSPGKPRCRGEAELFQGICQAPWGSGWPPTQSADVAGDR